LDKVWTIKALLDWSEKYFADKNIDAPKLTSQLLLSHILSLNRIDLFVQFERILTTKELATYKGLIVRRSTHEPLEYILGNSEFMGLKFTVSPEVLIPRPETEILVETACKLISEQGISTLVDIGTGSGCIAISIKNKFPDLKVYATDISAKALVVAQENSKALQADIIFSEGFYPEQLKAEKLMLVSNPPYIRSQDIGTLMPEVKDYEPLLALDGGESGFFVIEKLLDLYHVSKSEIMLMEIGYDQSEALEKMVADKKIACSLSFIQDYNKINRIAKITR